MSSVKSLERTISSYPRRLPAASVVQFPFSGLREEFMVSGTREALLDRDSRDPRVAAAEIEVRTGRKWRATEELEVAESQLRQRELVGKVPETELVLVTSQGPRLAKPWDMRGDRLSRRRFKQAWKKKEQAGWWA